MRSIDAYRDRLREDAEFAEAVAEYEDRLAAEVMQAALRVRPIKGAREETEQDVRNTGGQDEDGDEDGDVEVVYVDE